MKTIDEIKKNKRLIIMQSGEDGCIGYALINGQRFGFIFSWGGGWEHLSVSQTNRTPTWDEMCIAKNMFWNANECCVEYHPAESEYINIHPHCLHIWRPINAEMPTPPIAYV